MEIAAETWVFVYVNHINPDNFDEAGRQFLPLRIWLRTHTVRWKADKFSCALSLAFIELSYFCLNTKVLCMTLWEQDQANATFHLITLT